MRYDDPDRLDALAAEYVMGTLRGAARRRFERLLRDSAEARDAAQHWEALLGGLGGVLPAERPPARVWQGIEARLDGAPKTAGFWRSLRFWRVWGMGATAALVSLAIAVSLPAAAPEPVGQVAVVENQQDQPMWVITANPATGRVRARAVNARAAAVDRAYELWMVPASGPPRSLGLLPVNGGVTRHDIPPALLALLGKAQGVAISLEPAGGPPPAGPPARSSTRPLW